MESESSVKGRGSSPGDTRKAPGCRGDGLVGLGHTWKESYLLVPFFCEKQEGRASEQNAGEEGGQGWRVGAICSASALGESWLERGPGLARVHWGLVTILGAISLPRAVMFFGGIQQPRCKFKEQRVIALQG